MKKTYFQPEVTVAHFASTTLMQAASPAAGSPVGDQMGLSTTITDEQW